MNFGVTCLFVLCHFNRCNFNRSHFQPLKLPTTCPYDRFQIQLPQIRPILEKFMVIQYFQDVREQLRQLKNQLNVINRTVLRNFQKSYWTNYHIYQT